MKEVSAEVIEENDLFSGVPLTLLAEFLETAVEEVFPDQSIIVQEGNQTEGIYYVVDGQVHIVKDSNQYVDVLEKGECFGEMSLFSEEPASASVVANGPVTISFFNEETVSEFINANHEFAVPFFKNILDRMSYRLRRTTNALTKVRNRTEKLLQDEFHEIFDNVNLDVV